MDMVTHIMAVDPNVTDDRDTVKQYFNLRLRRQIRQDKFFAIPAFSTLGKAGAPAPNRRFYKGAEDIR